MTKIQISNRKISSARTARQLAVHFAVMVVLSLCLPFGNVHGQPSNDAVPPSHIEPQPPASLSTTQALQDMLELIQASSRVTDITPETVHRIFGVQTEATGKDEFGYGQRLPGNWAFRLEKMVLWGIGTQVALAFGPIPDTQASLLTSCEPDFAQFTAALESMGFRRHRRYAEHGRWISDVFVRQGMSVEVYLQRAFTDSGELQGLICVKRVHVQ